MASIIYDARRIKAYERLQELGAYAQKEQEFIDSVWDGLITDEELMNEFMYYLDHHAILDQVKCAGYGLTDLYVWHIGLYNLHREIGKNPMECNKEGIVLEAFLSMINMKKNPEEYVRRLSIDEGMDRF